MKNRFTETEKEALSILCDEMNPNSKHDQAKVLEQIAVMCGGFKTPANKTKHK